MIAVQKVRGHIRRKLQAMLWWYINHNEKIIIEVVHGTVIVGADENGQTVTGDYIKYNSGRSAGNIIDATLVYNPNTNAVDDIVYRANCFYQTLVL